jgi:hypothetical protein
MHGVASQTSSRMSTPWPEPPNYYDTPSKGYKVMLQKPGYPVIYPDPSVSQVGECQHAACIDRQAYRGGVATRLTYFLPFASVQHATKPLGIRCGNGRRWIRARILEG